MPDIIAELEALKADHAAALNLIEEAKASQDSIKGELAAAQELLKEKEAALTDSLNALASKGEELKKALSEIVSLKEAQKSAETQAVEIVAEQGIKPLKVSKEASKPTRDDVLSELAGITDPVKRGDFYTANRGVIFDN